MTYSQYSNVLALDYNSMTGGDPVSTSGKVNTVLGTGHGSTGYGQTAVGNVSVGGHVAASDWGNLISAVNVCGGQQNSSLATMTTTYSGNVITAQSNLVTNLTTIYNNRLNAATQGGTLNNIKTITGVNWFNNATFVHTVSFANADAARYFFNAGGTLGLLCSHAVGPATPIEIQLNTLATNVGGVVLAAPSSGTANIGGTVFNGITQIGGSGSPTIYPNNGYYSLSSISYVPAFAESLSDAYHTSTISVNVKSNGTQGLNGDTGNIVYLQTIWSVTPNTLVQGDTTVSLTVHYPSVLHLANTWGTVAVANSAVAT